MQQEQRTPLEEETQCYQKWQQHLMEEFLATPEGRARYEDLSESIDLWLELVEARHAAGFTRADLARRAGLKRKQVRFIEQHCFDACQIDALRRYAAAVGKRLHITLVEIHPDEGKSQDLVERRAGGPDSLHS